MSGSLTSISHQQLLRGGLSVRVLIFPWPDDVDAVGAFKHMPRYRLTYVTNLLRTGLRSASSMWMGCELHDAQAQYSSNISGPTLSVDIKGSKLTITILSFRWLHNNENISMNIVFLKGYKWDCRYMISHLVNGQDPRADHLSFGRNKRGHDQTWAVTEAQAWLHIQSLWGKGNRNSHTLAFLLIERITWIRMERFKEQSCTWKCLVCPGVAETETFLSLRIVLMVELFPTLGYPTYWIHTR